MYYENFKSKSKYKKDKNNIWTENKLHINTLIKKLLKIFNFHQIYFVFVLGYYALIVLCKL